MNYRKLKQRIATTCLLLVVLSSEPVAGQDRVAAEPKPEIVLIETNPWLMVIGSDSPSFALYTDGTVIYRGSESYRSVALSDADHADLLASVAALADPDATRSYNVSNATDQPSNYLLLLLDQPMAFSIYGNLDHSAVTSQLPAELSEALQRFRTFQSPTAETWVPELIEVMIWPYEYAPEDSIYWPENWPGLDDPRTESRGDGAYSIYIPASELDGLVAFLGTRLQRGAVEIDGHKFSASLRFPFPGEQLWMPDSAEDASGN